MYGLYSRAASNQERPMMARVRYFIFFLTHYFEINREVLIHSTFSILYCCYKSFSGQTWWLQWISELLHIFSEFQESPINKQALLRMSLAHGYFRIFLNKHFLICQMLWCLFEIIQFIHSFIPCFKHLDSSWDMFWIKSLGGTHFKRSNLAQNIF